MDPLFPAASSFLLLVCFMFRVFAGNDKNYLSAAAAEPGGPMPLSLTGCPVPEIPSLRPPAGRAPRKPVRF